MVRPRLPYDALPSLTLNHPGVGPLKYFSLDRPLNDHDPTLYASDRDSSRLCTITLCFPKPRRAGYRQRATGFYPSYAIFVSFRISQASAFYSWCATLIISPGMLHSYFPGSVLAYDPIPILFPLSYVLFSPLLFPFV